MGGDDMTRPFKVHYLRRVADETPRGLCHVTPKPWHVTRTRDEVTCGLCQRELAAVGCAPEEVCDDAPVFVPHEVDPMRGTSSPAGHDGFIGAKRERVAYRSIDEALLEWATLRRDAYPAKSMTEVLAAHSELGCHVGGGAGEPRAIRIADRIADLELCMRDAFDPRAWTGNVTAGHALAVVIQRAASTDALSDIADVLGITLQAAHGAVGKGRKRMSIEMGARGLIRRDDDTVETRRRELEGRR